MSEAGENGETVDEGSEGSLLEGLVIEVLGLTSIVDVEAHGSLKCDLRARVFRKQNRRLAVGDRVKLSLADAQDGETRGVIEELLERRTVLRRPRESKRDQILCANIDIVFIAVAILDPRYNRGFIDRVLVAAEREGLEAALLVNKVDLVTEDAFMDLVAEDFAVYGDLGYPVYFMSAQQGLGVEEVRAAFKDRISVVTGPSGVGKSTLLNTLMPGLNLRTGEVGKSRKGRHITTSARLVTLPQGGYVADTPGIRAFSVEGTDKRELASLFRDIEPHLGGCRFGDCSHREEPGCPVLEAVEDGDIDEARFESYLRLYEDLDAPRRR